MTFSRIAYNISVMEKNFYTFPDGLKLVHCRADGVYSAALTVMTGAGSGNESAENNGISHCVEHMLFKGTGKRTAFEISNDIDKLGAQSNAFTSKLATGYYTVGLAEHLEECADVLSDILTNSTFDDKELDKERKVIDEEISMSEDDGADLCLDELSRVYFGDHALGRTILGPRENVARFKGADLRKYVAENYASDSTVVCIAGNVEFERAKAVAERYFAGKLPRLGRRWQDEKAQTKPGRFVREKADEQAHLGIAFPSLPYKHEKDAALAVFNAVLGGSMSSRLFQEVREKEGLAYSVFSAMSTYINNGYMCVYAGINPANAEKAAHTIARVIKEIKTTRPITQEELERGKEQIKTAYALSGENMGGCASLYSRYTLYTGELLDTGREIERVQKVTLDDMAWLAEHILRPEEASISYVGKNAEGKGERLSCAARQWR